MKKLLFITAIFLQACTGNTEAQKEKTKLTYSQIVIGDVIYNCGGGSLKKLKCVSSYNGETVIIYNPTNIIQRYK